jgi:hypothetical protein
VRWLLQFLILLSLLATPCVALDAHAQAPSVSLDESAPVTVPMASDNTIRYQQGNTGWSLVSLIWSLAIPAVILWTGMSARIMCCGKPSRPLCS